MCLQFGFVILWQKAFGAKGAHKMFVKLTPAGVITDKKSSTILIYQNKGKSIYRQMKVLIKMAKGLSK
jgi:hypothetical protein